MNKQWNLSGIVPLMFLCSLARLSPVAWLYEDLEDLDLDTDIPTSSGEGPFARGRAPSLPGGKPISADEAKVCKPLLETVMLLMAILGDISGTLVIEG